MVAHARTHGLIWVAVATMAVATLIMINSEIGAWSRTAIAKILIGDIANQHYCIDLQVLPVPSLVALIRTASRTATVMVARNTQQVHGALLTGKQVSAGIKNGETLQPSSSMAKPCSPHAVLAEEANETTSTRSPAKPLPVPLGTDANARLPGRRQTEVVVRIPVAIQTAILLAIGAS
jgi:hypothetical protein